MVLRPRVAGRRRAGHEPRRGCGHPGQVQPGCRAGVLRRAPVQLHSAPIAGIAAAAGRWRRFTLRHAHGHPLPRWLRGLLYRPIHQFGHSRHAAWQARGGAMCATGRAGPLPPVRLADAASGLHQPASVRGHVRCIARPGAGHVDGTGARHAAVAARTPRTVTHAPDALPALRLSRRVRCPDTDP